eukprot:scaffold104846_cov58-Attheya_sp.AAC.1
MADTNETVELPKQNAVVVASIDIPPPPLPDPSSSSHKNDQPQKGDRKKKRGMKQQQQQQQRSKRVRKRPGGEGLGAGITEETLDTQIMTLDALSTCDRLKRIRIVKPYPYTFATFAKERWIGRTVLDVYHDEFGSYPKSYYEAAINEGRILVSGKRVTCDFLIKGGHELTHTVHRHEPAVAVCDLLLEKDDTIVVEDREKKLIRIVHESDSVIVVDKPSTLPIHPCGGYNYNSLIHILTSERPDLKGKVFTVHRLDRLTSGLTIFAKSTEVAKSMGKCIMDRDHCQKVYLARVKGKFPLHVPPELRTKSSPDQPNVPPFVHGEERMNSATMNDSNQHASSEGENSRSNFGLGFWVTDSSGMVHDNTTLTSVFESGSSIDTLLRDLEKETTNNQPDRSSLPGDISISSTTPSKETDSPNEEKEASSGVYWFHLACPTRIAVKKTGICEAGSFSNLDPSLYRKTVKPAQTSFAVVEYDAKTDSTVVLCKPVTGRTHQIRLHLEYMGHPIANDPNYSGEIWFGDEKGERLYKESRIKLDNDEKSSASHVVVVRPHPDNATTTDVPATEEEVLNAANCPRIEGESLLDFIKKTCVWCARSKSEDCTMLEFLVRSRGIWLHALQYCIRGVDGQQKCYRTDSPAWSHI